ncbi:hypothetical protein EV652_103222 [Kribbella steppae]|uniref:DUF6318 domain-containing protein n=1 Tax=Kribbella steppae TaxID=2512223 RepID=A0A4R2HPS8_9ACTN|nr:DUF6318 family protein [Kribbella steppae]TCO33223.1 hypothetical protein EV652_103222 [Kribbella steppae]
MTNRNRPLPLLLACLTTALLTACTSSPEAGRPNTNPTSAPATTSNGPTGTTPPTTTSASPSGPPSRPPAADGLTLGAAEAFVRHYIDLMNYASQTGDGAPLLAASEAGCEGCKQYAGFAAKVNGANGGLSGDYFERVTEVSELVRRDSGHLGGSARVTVGAYTTKESPSAKPVTSKPASYTEQIALSSNGGNWIMYEIKLEER